MLEGVSREAGPFEFVVRADGARVPRTARVGRWLGARAPDCARGPVAGRACPGLCAWAGGWARVPRTVRVGQWTTGRACPWRWRSRNVRVGQWTTGCAGLELCARAPLLAALTH